VSRSVSAQSLARFRAYLDRTRAARVQADDSIHPRVPGTVVEASEAQQQLWLHSEMAGSVPLYNEPVTVHYHGELNVPAFEKAFNEILRRHEAWRTSFVLRDEKLIQVIAPEIRVEFTATDLRTLSKSKREERALALATSDAKQIFDLQRAPLFRTRLFRLEDAEYRLYLTLHHIIFDGVSLYRVFLPELQALYSAFVTGVDAGLDPVPVQYADYSLWQRRWLLNGGADEQLQYWKNALSGDLPELKLPFDHPRAAVSSRAGAMVTFTIAADTTAIAKEVAQARDATLYMAMLAAFHVLLYHYTGDCDQIIGSVTSGRKHNATMHMMGLFLNTIALRTAFLPDEPFTALVSRVRETTLNALSNDDAPFGYLVSHFDKTRKTGLNPFFGVMFSLEPPLSPLSPGWAFTQMDVETDISKIDLHLELDEREEGLLGRFIYSTELFEEETIRRMAACWASLIDFIAKNPNQSVSRLSERLHTPASAVEQRPISLLGRFQKLWK
jgi:surfactin family lipopeptide synthetase A